MIYRDMIDEMDVLMHQGKVGTIDVIPYGTRHSIDCLDDIYNLIYLSKEALQRLAKTMIIEEGTTRDRL